MKTITLDDKSYVLFKELLTELTENYEERYEKSYSCGGQDYYYTQYDGDPSDEDSVVGKAKTILSKLTECEQRDIKIGGLVNNE